MGNKLYRAIASGVFGLVFAGAASATVTYNLNNVQTFGNSGAGQLLGFFELDRDASGRGIVGNYIITAVLQDPLDNSPFVAFEWSSNPGFPYPSITQAMYDVSTGIVDVIFSEALPRGPEDVSHSVTLELAFMLDPFSSIYPLITAPNGNQPFTSNWTEIVRDHDYGRYGNVTSGFLSVPEPGSLALLAVGLCGLGATRTRSKGTAVTSLTAR